MDTKIVAANEEGLAEAARLLAAGALVAMPTETVYGLAAPMDDEGALRRVFEAKGRPLTDPLIVHVTPALWSGCAAAAAESDAPPTHLDGLAAIGLVDLGALSIGARAAAERLLACEWPGPLTVVLPRGPRVPDLVTGGLDTVALRMPWHPVAIALISAVGAPLCAPSANRFGRVSPTSAADVVAELGGKVALVLDAGRCEVGVESTVVRVEPSGAEHEAPVFTILRPGGVAQEAIQERAGRGVVVRTLSSTPSSTPGSAQRSPGLLDSHYAPSTQLIRLSGVVTALDRASLAAALMRASAAPLGLLVCAGDVDAAAAALSAATGARVVARVLSPSGDDVEAAHELFGALRALDAAGVGAILVEPPPRTTGLWRAVDDRLARAAREDRPDRPASRDLA